VEEVSKDTFEEEIIKSGRPVVVDFWGPRCVPCLALMPNVEALSEKYAGKLKIAKVEAPKNRRLCIELKVLALPTFLFYKDGKEVGRLSGNTLSIEMIEAAIRRIL
jgi:thioredoxin 1